MARTYSGGLVSPKYPGYYGYFRNIKENLRNQPQTMDPLSQSVTVHLLKWWRRALYTNKQRIYIHCYQSEYGSESVETILKKLLVLTKPNLQI